MIDFVDLFKNIPAEVATVLTAMTPVGELRVALPIAITVYAMPFWKAFLLSIFGNIIPVIFIVWLLEPLSQFLMKRSRLSERFFTWLFKRTRKKYAHRFEKWGALALITFVAIPLPITGGWTGSLAAFVFGVPFKKALPAIFLGIVIAGIIVGIVTLGVERILI